MDSIRFSLLAFVITITVNAFAQRAFYEGEQVLEYQGSFDRVWKEFMPEYRLDIPLSVNFKLRVDFTPGVIPKGTIGSVVARFKRKDEIFINGERFTEKSMPKELWDSFRIDGILVRAQVIGPNGIIGYLKGNAFAVPLPDNVVQHVDQKEGWSTLICDGPCWTSSLNKTNTVDQVAVEFKILTIENISVYSSMSRFRSWYETRRK